MHLEAQDLSGNPVADLRVLGALPRLRVLNLDGVRPDLWSLAGLGGLRELSLRGSRIRDLTGLGTLTGLKRLVLRDNPVSDVWPLTALTALEALDLRGTAVRDASALAGLRSLRQLRLPEDGGAWLSGNCDRRVLRGGSWGNNPFFLRAANRWRHKPSQYTGRFDFSKEDNVGFRIARTLSP